MNTRARTGRIDRGRSRERSPLRPHGYPTPQYGGTTGPAPRPFGQQPPPPYSAAQDTPGGESERKEIERGGFLCGMFTLLVVIVFVSFYFVPVKIDKYTDAVAQLREQQVLMREEAKHLRDERQLFEHERLVLGEDRERWEKACENSRVREAAMREAAKHLEIERQLLEDERLVLKEGREMWEKAREDSRLQQAATREEEKRLEVERRSLEHERLVLKEERERWEKARDDVRVPQGAFWDVVWPRWECRAYGKREYWGILRNIPQDRSDIDACMNMPVEIQGVTIKRPGRCEYVEGSPYIHAYWIVDWDQPDCQPWHKDFRDKGCTNPGSGVRRIEAELVGINRKGQQDWYVLCETTPMTWKHVTYNNPTHCDERDHEKKFAMWDIADSRC